MARKAAKTAVKASGTKKKTGAAGGKKTGSGGSDGKYDVTPDYVCEDLGAAVDVILGEET